MSRIQRPYAHWNSSTLQVAGITSEAAQTHTDAQMCLIDADAGKDGAAVGCLRDFEASLLSLSETIREMKDKLNSLLRQ